MSRGREGSAFAPSLRSSAVRIAVAVALGFLLPAFSAAETTEILATGPDLKRGIPYLSPNVIEYLLVTYRTAAQVRSDSDAPGSIRVLYSKAAVVPADAWHPSPCSSARLLVVRKQPTVLFYQGEGDWSLFFVFPVDDSNACSFAGAFITRFHYFLGITKNSALSSFPAVLNVP